LLRVFEERPIVFFTGIREPTARAVSEFGQITAAMVAAGQNLPTVQDYLETSANGLCHEILRCFPTVTQTVEGPLWEQARAAASLFDFIYATEQFDRDATVILDLLEIPHDRLVRDNSFADKRLPDAAADAIREATQAIKAQAHRYYADDLRLYRELAPYVGVPELRKTVAQQPWALDRDRFMEALPDLESAWTKFRRLEMEYLIYEFYSLGKIDLLKRSIEGEHAHLGEILVRLADYSPAPSC
jgi:hypothetical protein